MMSFERIVLSQWDPAEEDPPSSSSLYEVKDEHPYWVLAQARTYGNAIHVGIDAES